MWAIDFAPPASCDIPATIDPNACTTPGVTGCPDSDPSSRPLNAQIEAALYISDVRQPHEATEDMSAAWRNLQHFLDPTRW